MSVFESVEKDLKTLGLSDSSEGAAALVLAARLDVPDDSDSVAGLAAAARELRQLMEGLRARPVAAVADPLDELVSRRTKRRNA
jgi:hypothetical protein